MTRLSQKQVILNELESGAWVNLPTLMDLKANGNRIANITGRISNLREDGHKIINVEQYNKEKRCYVSWYRLVKPEPKPKPMQERLF